MIVALDTETIPNAEALKIMPDPEVKLGNTKDEAKIAEKVAEAKAKQEEKAALCSLTARICCFALVGEINGEPTEYTSVLQSDDDDAERVFVGEIMGILANPDLRLITHDGIRFDMPIIYHRAIILGVDIGDAPLLSTWTQRFRTDRHYDLAKIWTNWQPGECIKNDTLADIVLGPDKDAGPEKHYGWDITTPEGREEVASHCLRHTRKTYRIFERMNGFLFA